MPHWNYKQWAVAQGWPTQRREESLVYSDIWKESLDVKQLQRMNVVSGWGIRFTMMDVVWQSPDAQGWDSGHGSIGISSQVPEGTLFVIREALISQCPSAAPWMPGSTRKKEEGITRRAMASSNLYSLFAANKTKTGALESVKLWMLGYQLTGLFPTRMPGQGFPSHVKSAASAFTASQVQ